MTGMVGSSGHNPIVLQVIAHGSRPSLSPPLDHIALLLVDLPVKAMDNGQKIVTFPMGTTKEHIFFIGYS